MAAIVIPMILAMPSLCDIDGNYGKHGIYKIVKLSTVPLN